jgi:hypothetical protein
MQLKQKVSMGILIGLGVLYVIREVADGEIE